MLVVIIASVVLVYFKMLILKVFFLCFEYFDFHFYRVTDKSLARPTFRCILFDGENISFAASLVIYIYICMNSNNIPPIMFINSIYENQNLLSL